MNLKDKQIIMGPIPELDIGQKFLYSKDVKEKILDLKSKWYIDCDYSGAQIIHAIDEILGDFEK